MTKVVYIECSSCSGKLMEVIKGIKQCMSCFGVHGKYTEEMSYFVNLSLPMKEEAENQRYFDVLYKGKRVHGWHCTDTCRVVQYG